ncbi:MAG: MGH1-like glycoside hydrolase domain-containing protein [Acidimicrobiales bacterium]
MDRTSEARGVLRRNDRGRYTVPTAELYPFQWNWDSAFVALGWAEFDRGRAWAEVECLLAAQWPSGMVPHIVFWSDEATYFPGPAVWQTARSHPATSGISQPPVLATVVRRLVATGEHPTLESICSSIDSWHRWWHAARDPEGRGVIAVSHPWESGRDNLPDWDRPLAAVDPSSNASLERRDLDLVDAAMRPSHADYERYAALIEVGVAHRWDDGAIATNSPFWVADPGVTAILLRAERDLAWIMAAIGADTTSVESRIDRLEAGFEQLWNPAARAYCSIDLRTGLRAMVGTAASFLGPYAGVVSHLDDSLAELECWATTANHLVPSFDPRHADFEPQRYWRGPVWAVVNYLIATGLAEHGAGDWAERIRRSTRGLIERSGMAESFDPVTGAAVGGDRFGWTAAMWLAWAGRPERSTDHSAPT